MMKLHTFAEREASARMPSGMWCELAPGPDDQRSWAADGVFFWFDEWERIGEPLIASRIPGYDRHLRVNGDAGVWLPVLAYLDDVSRRLRAADEPAMVHVLLPELDVKLLWELSKGFPAKPIELTSDLEALSLWVKQALKRWHSVTIIGL